jgi:hypothetical protein
MLSMPEPRCGSAHGVEAQSEGDFEAFGGDLVDEIACAISTQSAPPSHCHGSDTTFSSTHVRAASLTGLIEMIEP